MTLAISAGLLLATGVLESSAKGRHILHVVLSIGNVVSVVILALQLLLMFIRFVRVRLFGAGRQAGRRPLN